MHARHLDEEQIERVRHGELAPDAAPRVHAHLSACATCRDRVATAAREEDEVHGLLQALDHPPPRLTAHDLARRAHAGRPAWARLAAGIVFALAAASVAYAAPGSPLPSLVSSAADRLTGRADGPELPAPGLPAPVMSGIAVAPGRSLAIVFARPQRAGDVVVSIIDGAELTVTAPGGAATYESAADRLSIHNTDGTASFAVAMPRAAPRIEIFVGAQRVFLKDGARISGGTPDDSRTRYVVPLHD